MATDPAPSMEALCRNLSEHVMGAALCAEQIISSVHELLGCPAHENGNGRRGASPQERPLVDESTLSVTWRGRTAHLGHTQPYLLLARLTRNANRYAEHLDLLQEIWDDEFTDAAALRAGMNRLRTKLRRAGMADLADAIVGHQGRYMLDLT